MPSGRTGNLPACRHECVKAEGRYDSGGRFHPTQLNVKLAFGVVTGKNGSRDENAPVHKGDDNRETAATETEISITAAPMIWTCAVVTSSMSRAESSILMVLT